MDRTLALACLVALSLTACPSADAPEPDPEPGPSAPTTTAAAPPSGADRCDAHRPERQVFWGDLHVHTGVSMDAYMFGTRLRPADAYRFARGEPVELGDPAAGTARTVQIERPLDFAAVTDHAMNFGGVKLCTTPGSDVYDSEICTRYRSPLQLAGELRQIVREIQERTGDALSMGAVCGEDGARCRAAAVDVWQETIDAAAAHDDPSAACEFTTFVAYEYTATPELTKIHRNVIFRNDAVPEVPISFLDEPTALGLWRQLDAQCIEAGTGCDVLAIPHNANFSNGNLFAIEYGGAETVAEQAEVAALRARMEPLVEMSQMKGDSECRNGMWNVLGATDELCNFEKIRAPDTPDCEDGTGQGALGGAGCISRRDFARYALVDGLMEADRLGVNPFKMGFIASTDGHDGTPGATEEWRQDLGVGRPQPGAGRNPGGLVAVWAEENSRESLFEAMRRRETYGTSGTRLSVRLFGGWKYEASLCDAPDLVAQGYAGGVSMGGDLPTATSEAPRFVVSALRDPGTAARPGTPLQRVQIVKGWYDEDGNIHQQVVDVAGGPNDASVDTATCAPQGAGHDQLCGVWQDPDFDPARRAVYYARVVENPSCRQTGWTCTGPEEQRPAWCAMPGLERTTQERGWTSPIWYTPPEGSAS